MHLHGNENNGNILYRFLFSQVNEKGEAVQSWHDVIEKYQVGRIVL